LNGAPIGERSERASWNLRMRADSGVRTSDVLDSRDNRKDNKSHLELLSNSVEFIVVIAFAGVMPNAVKWRF